MKLSKMEKDEIIFDSFNKNRMNELRKTQFSNTIKSYEKYIKWLDEIQKICPVLKKKKRFCEYKNIIM